MRFRKSDFYLRPACHLGFCFAHGCRAHEEQRSNGLTPVRLQLDWYPQPEHGGFYTALLKGYYKAEGLDVTILPLPQYGSVAQLVTSGRPILGWARATRFWSGIRTACRWLPLPRRCSTIRRRSWSTRIRRFMTSRISKGTRLPRSRALPGSSMLSRATTCTRCARFRRRSRLPTFLPIPTMCSRSLLPANRFLPSRPEPTCEHC